MSSAELAVLNVGQGDCIVLHDPGDASVAIVDCPFGARAKPLGFLVANSVRRVRGVVVTHLHDDHYGGIADLLTRMRPDALYYGIAYGYKKPHAAADGFLRAMLDATERHGIQDVGMAREGQVINFGTIRIEFLGPNDRELLKALPSNNPNHACAILRAEIGSFSALLGGDAMPWRWKALLDRGANLRADVLVMLHHGGSFWHRLISLGDLLDAVQPRVIVLSAASANSYGHPAAATLTDLRSYALANGARVICTQLNEICRVAALRAGGGPVDLACAGDIVVGQGFGVTTSRAGHRDLVNHAANGDLPERLQNPRCAPVPAAAP